MEANEKKQTKKGWFEVNHLQRGIRSFEKVAKFLFPISLGFLVFVNGTLLPQLRNVLESPSIGEYDVYVLSFINGIKTLNNNMLWSSILFIICIFPIQDFSPINTIHNEKTLEIIYFVRYLIIQICISIGFIIILCVLFQFKNSIS